MVCCGWLAPSSILAMHYEQMLAIAGVALLESRVDRVVQVLGPPAIVQRDAAREDRFAATTLGGLSVTGDWRLRYRPGSGPGWAPPDLQARGLPLSASAFSRMELQAQGGVERLVVRRAPERTGSEMPADPYQAHRVVSARADLRHPLPLAVLEAVYGGQWEAVSDVGGARWLRYWVTQFQGEVPLRLYAVDFRLDPRGTEVIGLRANGPRIGFVKDELAARHALWERNLYD